MHSMRWRRRGAMVAVALGAMLAASGCAASSPSEASSALPDGLTVSMYQTRTDYGPRKLELSITNGTDGPVTIERLVFDSTQFVEAVQWEKDSTTIPAGATRDLPVSLAAPACDVDDPVHVVEFDYVLADGTSGTAVAEPVDRIDRMPDLRLEDCITEAVAEIAVVTADQAPRTVDVAGQPVVALDLRVEPTGAAGEVEFLSVRSTTLYMMVDPATGGAVNEETLGVTVRGTDEPSILTILVTPGRCDPHALMEDKIGTVWRIAVRTPDGEGTVPIPSADPVKAALYDIVTAKCSG